jgi:hypothetical protein
VQEASERLLMKKINEIEGLLLGPHELDEITAKVPDNNGPVLGALPYQCRAPRTRIYSCRMHRFCRKVDQQGGSQRARKEENQPAAA